MNSENISHSENGRDPREVICELSDYVGPIWTLFQPHDVPAYMTPNEGRSAINHRAMFLERLATKIFEELPNLDEADYFDLMRILEKKIATRHNEKMLNLNSIYRFAYGPKLPNFILEIGDMGLFRNQFHNATFSGPITNLFSLNFHTDVGDFFYVEFIFHNSGTFRLFEDGSINSDRSGGVGKLRVKYGSTDHLYLTQIYFAGCSIREMPYEMREKLSKTKINQA